MIGVGVRMVGVNGPMSLLARTDWLRRTCRGDRLVALH